MAWRESDAKSRDHVGRTDAGALIFCAGHIAVDLLIMNYYDSSERLYAEGTKRVQRESCAWARRSSPGEALQDYEVLLAHFDINVIPLALHQCSQRVFFA
jgi:hypothetical protein